MIQRVSDDWVDIEKQIIKYFGIEKWNKNGPRVWESERGLRPRNVNIQRLNNELKNHGFYGFKNNGIVLNRWVRDLVNQNQKIVLSSVRLHEFEKQLYRAFDWKFLKISAKNLNYRQINQIIETLKSWRKHDSK